MSQAPLLRYEVARLVARKAVVSGSSSVKGITVIAEQSASAASRNSVSWLTLFQ